MVFWIVVAVALLIVLTVMWRYDRRRRGHRMDMSHVDDAKGKALREGYSAPQNSHGFPPSSGPSGF